MKLDIYQVNEKYFSALDYLNGLDDADLTDDVINDSLMGFSEEAAEASCAYIKNLELRISAMKNYESEMKSKRISEELKREKFKRYLIDKMQASNLKRIPSNELAISLRNNAPRVVIDSSIDVLDLPEEFLRIKTITEPDKEKIKAALNGGEKIKGCSLETCKSLIIK